MDSAAMATTLISPSVSKALKSTSITLTMLWPPPESSRKLPCSAGGGARSSGSATTGDYAPFSSKATMSVTRSSASSVSRRSSPTGSSRL